MSTISSLGIGSGLDLNALVDQLLKAEREPREQRFNRREAGLQAQVSAFGTLRGGLAELETATGKLAGLREGRTATSSDSGRLAVEATGEAGSGRYRIEVENLAAAQSLASVAFDSATEAVGAGTLTLKVGERDAVNININAGNNSLSGVRDAINEANAGVGASIVNDGNGARLVLTANSTGAASTIALTVADADGDNTDMAGLSRLSTVNLEETSAARDARVTINGLTVTSASNTLDKAIEGLTLELKGTTEAGSPITVDVGQDRAAIREALEGFIKAYNAVVKQVSDFTRYNPETREAGLLLGDSTVRSLGSRLSASLNQNGGGANGAVQNLVSLGVRTDASGALSLAPGSLERALDQDFAGTLAMVNDVAGGLRDTVRGFTERGGLLDNRADGLRSNIRDIDRQRQALDLRMEQMEARLSRQFGALDAMIGQMQNTSAFLDQQLSNLNNLFLDRRRR